MSETNVHRCLACGAPLNAPVQGGRIKCAYCGAVNVVHAHEKAQGDDIICPECGAANPKIAKHCGRCGIKLEFNCPKCGTLNSYGTVFCVQCGIDVPGEIKRQQEELLRQQNEERRRQEEMHQRFEEEKKKRAHRSRISLLVVAGLFLVGALCIAGIVGIGTYTANSPSAKSTKTAIAAGQMATGRAFAAGQTATAAYRVLFQDDFSDPTSGWGDFSDDTGSTGYENGYFRIHVIKANWVIFYYLDNIFPNNVSIEVDAANLGGSDNNGFGIICRLQDNKNYDYLAVSSLGLAAIAKTTDGNAKIISTSEGKWSGASIVNSGSTTNQLRADCVGNTLTLYVNGVKVATAADDSFTGGKVGLEAESWDKGKVDIRFDNFGVYRP